MKNNSEEITKRIIRQSIKENIDSIPYDTMYRDSAVIDKVCMELWQKHGIGVSGTDVFHELEYLGLQKEFNNKYSDEQEQNNDAVQDTKQELESEKEYKKFISTYSGYDFHYLNPRAEDIDINDIAHALSLLCRGAGHIAKFYSVAEHCYLTSKWAEEELGDIELAKWMLMHDAPEAYLADLPTPLKKLLPDYLKMEDSIMAVIADKYNLDPTITEAQVKEIDKQILLTERNTLMTHVKTRWVYDDLYEPMPIELPTWSPDEAKIKYMEQFNKLFK